jgi:hypothetical protein
MKKFCLILLASLVLASSAFATVTTCPVGTLSLYLVPGFSCTTNGLTFAGWTYSSAGTGQGQAIPATGVQVTPQVALGAEGFQFNAGWSVSGSSSTEDSLIGFTASGGIIDLELFFNGSVTGTGQSGVSETYCMNHALAGCPTGSSGQIAVTNPPPGFNSHVFFAAVNSVSVSKDILVDTGNNGTAMISQVVNNFSSPEPLSFVLLGSGLLGLGLLRKRMKR